MSDQSIDTEPTFPTIPEATWKDRSQNSEIGPDPVERPTGHLPVQ